MEDIKCLTVEEVFQVYIPFGLFSVVRIHCDFFISGELILNVFKKSDQQNKTITDYISKIPKLISGQQQVELLTKVSNSLIVPYSYKRKKDRYIFFSYTNKLKFNGVMVCDETFEFHPQQYFATLHLF